jgi:hypothetical protein
MKVSTPAGARHRRAFLLRLLAGSAAVLAGARAASAAEALDPTDGYARSMGYVLNTEQVDQSRYPRHAADQKCHGCKLWNGGDNDVGNCSFFDGATSPKNGWCKNWKLPKAPVG